MTTESITPAKTETTHVAKMTDWVNEFLADSSSVPLKDKPASDSTKVDVKVETKAEVKPESEKAQVKVEETAKPKDEGESKRLKDTRDWATRVQQQNVELGKQLEAAIASVKTLEAKLDGTYVEPAPLTQVEIEQRAVDNTKLAASHYAAVAMLEAQGVTDPEAEVVKLIWAPDAPFQELQKDPAIMSRVLRAKLPVIEAIKVVREVEARKQYGDTPEAMKAALRKEIEAQIKEETRKQVLDELKKGGKAPLETVAGLSDARGASRVDAQISNEGTITMESLFPNFKS